jgi:type III secretion system chaperone SycN
MGSLEQVLAEFGQDIGLTALAPSAQGHVQLRLDSGALLGASTQDEEVVLHYAEPVEHGAAPLVFAALRRAGRVETAADPVQVGLRSTGQGDWLVVGTRLPLERLSVREVHRLATYLQSWLAQVRQNR